MGLINEAVVYSVVEGIRSYWHPDAQLFSRSEEQLTSLVLCTSVLMKSNYIHSSKRTYA